MTETGCQYAAMWCFDQVAGQPVASCCMAVLLSCGLGGACCASSIVTVTTFTLHQLPHLIANHTAIRSRRARRVRRAACSASPEDARGDIPCVLVPVCASCTSPLSMPPVASYRSAAVATDGAAAEHRDTAKRAAYARYANAGLESVHFSVETHGRLGVLAA